MKNILAFVLFAMALSLTACSTAEREPESDKNYLSGSSDLKGEWTVVQATTNRYKGIKMVLDDKRTLTWISAYGDYVGKYYMFENVDDDILRHECYMLNHNITDANKLHIGNISVLGYDIEDKSYLELHIICDLYNYLIDRKYQHFNEEADLSTWLYWSQKILLYKFDVVSYSPISMTLRLKEQPANYENKERMPMQLADKEVWTLTRTK